MSKNIEYLLNKIRNLEDEISSKNKKIEELERDSRWTAHQILSNDFFKNINENTDFPFLHVFVDVYTQYESRWKLCLIFKDLYNQINSIPISEVNVMGNHREDYLDSIEGKITEGPFPSRMASESLWLVNHMNLPMKISINNNDKIKVYSVFKKEKYLNVVFEKKFNVKKECLDKEDIKDPLDYINYAKLGEYKRR